MTKIRAFFIQIRVLFSNFRKRTGETSPLHPLVTRVNIFKLNNRVLLLTLNLPNNIFIVEFQLSIVDSKQITVCWEYMFLVSPIKTKHI